MNKIRNESEFQRFIRKSISYTFINQCKIKKNHGNMYSEKGVADLDGHILGHYIAIECKMWPGRPSTEQMAFCRSVMNTGGFAAFAIYRYEPADKGNEHRCFWVPGDMMFSYRQKMIWPNCGLIKVPRDPREPDGQKIEVFDCSLLKTFLEMR